MVEFDFLAEKVGLLIGLLKLLDALSLFCLEVGGCLDGEWSLGCDLSCNSFNLSVGLAFFEPVLDKF